MNNKEYIQDGIKIILDKPPVWDSVCKAFNIIPRKAIFAYGDTIYNPDSITLPNFLIEHEKVHFGQQKLAGGAAFWWGKYLRDPEFRYSQEVEAYAVQYNQMKKLTNDRNKHVQMLYELSQSLSGPLYNNIRPRDEAENDIRTTALALAQ